ncbi:MAG TPA: SUKH-3 domain-containing protein [Pirellulales bacterium]|jgi:hypothetical protein|nr:SUKH-3 domain-containing protein [Pirellulales bacterium]
MTNHNSKQADFVFSQVVSAYLRKAGWSPTRVVPTSVYERAYENEHLRFVVEVKEFLRHFGGLIIKYKMPTKVPDVLEFEAEHAVRGMGRGALRSFEELTKASALFPIGHYQGGTCMLLMDEGGKVFGGSDTCVCLIGRTGSEAVETILTGSRVTVLDE